MTLLGSMPDLHAGTLACVAGISTANEISLEKAERSLTAMALVTYPLLSSLGGQALGAVAVPHTRSLEASIGDSSKGSASDEQVRVSTRQDVGHHSARRTSGHEDLVFGYAPVLDGISHNGGDSKGVTATVVG